MSELIGVIPAAGKGVRAYPYTATIPKTMLDVDGTPLLERNIRLMHDQLGIDEVRVVVGHHGEMIRRRYGNGGGLGVRITYVENPRVDLELAYSIHLGVRDLDRPCVVILGDECYVGSNHDELLAQRGDTALVACAVIAAESARHMRKNYRVVVRDGRIVDLEEKPARASGSLMGTGTYLLQPRVYELLAEAYASGIENGPRDWTGWLATLARRGEPLVPFELRGKYVNVNSRDDLNLANALVRDCSFDQKMTSLVYVVDEHNETAARFLKQFDDQKDIDEIVVVARHGDAALAAAVAAVGGALVTAGDAEVPFGELIKRGLDRARGSLLLMVAGDETVAPRDVAKLLVYLRDADMVVGTRTTRQMLEQATNMRGVVRTAHLVLAKLLELLWWRFDARFTDICCMYRGLWRSTYQSIRENLQAPDLEIYPEMIVEVLRARGRIIEIPINYYNPDLEQPGTPGRHQTVANFLSVVRLLLRRRLADLSWSARLRRRTSSS